MSVSNVLLFAVERPGISFARCDSTQGEDRSNWVPHVIFFLGFLGAQMVKNPPTMQKTGVQSLCWEDPLEKEMAIPSSILAWRIPCQEEHGRLESMGLQRVRHNWATNTNCHCFQIVSWAVIGLLHLFPESLESPFSVACWQCYENHGFIYFV